jgi:hypothetical protein
MGVRGPIPKRADMKVRHVKAGDAPTKVSAIGRVAVPSLGFDDPHPLTAEMWESLHSSAQSRFFEPSDWTHAKSVLHFLDLQLKSSRPGAQMLQTLFSELGNLLVTEGSRRRLRLEIDRAEAADAQVDVAALFREKLTG